MVPESNVILTVPVDSLKALPEGAMFRAHEGRSEVELRHLPATGSEPERIEVRATAASLQLNMEQERQVAEMDIQGISQTASNNEEQLQQKDCMWPRLRTAWRAFVFGIVLSLIAMIIIRIKIKKH